MRNFSVGIPVDTSFVRDSITIKQISAVPGRFVCVLTASFQRCSLYWPILNTRVKQILLDHHPQLSPEQLSLPSLHMAPSPWTLAHPSSEISKPLLSFPCLGRHQARVPRLWQRAVCRRRCSLTCCRAHSSPSWRRGWDEMCCSTAWLN